MPVNYGGFLGGFLNTEEAVAGIEGQKLANAQNSLGLEQARINADIQAKTRTALEAAAAESIAKGNAPDGISFEPPDLASTNPLQTGGGPKLSDLHLKEYNDELKAAKAVAAVGNVMEHSKRLKAANEALAKATVARAEERKDRVERLERVGNVLAGISDEETLNAAINNFSGEYPEITQQLGKMGFERGPGGRYLWNEAAGQKTKAIKDVVLTEKDRMLNADRDERRALEKKRAEEAERAHKESEDHKRRMEQLARESAADRAAARTETAEARKQREADKKNKDSQRSLERDPLYRDWVKYDIAHDNARSAISKLENGTFKYDVDAQQIHSLIAQYNGLKEGFRPQAGGKYQMQEVEKFNGMLDNMSKWWSSLGKGTPKLSEEQMRGLALNMTELYDIANKNVLIRYYQEAETLKRKGGDPAELTKKGDMNRLKALNQVWTSFEDGKQYLNIGTKEKSQKFAVDEE